MSIANIQQLCDAVRNGVRPAVRFGRGIDDLGGYAQAGMRARVSRVDDMASDMMAVTFDYTEFEAHNIPLETADYYDGDGRPTLTARAAGRYEKQEIYFFDPTEPIATEFTFIDNEALALYGEFTANGAVSSQSYVSWLEQQLLAARARVSP